MGNPGFFQSFDRIGDTRPLFVENGFIEPEMQRNPVQPGRNVRPLVCGDPFQQGIQLRQNLLAFSGNFPVAVFERQVGKIGIPILFDDLIDDGDILLAVLHGAFQRGNLLFGIEYVAVMLFLHGFELPQFRIQFNLADRFGVAADRGRECGVIAAFGVLVGQYAGFGRAGHRLLDELVFAGERLIGGGIQRPVDGVVENLRFRDFVPLPDNASIALLHVGGANRGVEVMGAGQAALHVHADSEFRGGTDHDAHVPGVHGVEKLRPLPVGGVIRDHRDLMFGNAERCQFLFDLLIDVEFPVR